MSGAQPPLPPPPAEPTIHAGAVLLGAAGVLLRGASGAGKSALGLALVDRFRSRGLFAALVADDRVHVAARHGRLVARAPERIAGLVERWGRGILSVPHEPACVVRLVVDCLDEEALERMPEARSLTAEIAGIRLPRQPVPARSLAVACPLVEDALAALPPPGTSQSSG
jgi:HPr kinase/phosphorylase